MYRSKASSIFIARTVSNAVSALPEVARLTTGRHGGSVTYGPGETVRGVAVRGRSGGYAVQIRLIAEISPSTDLVEFANRVHSTAVESVKRHDVETDLLINVVIDDILPGNRDR